MSVALQRLMSSYVLALDEGTTSCRAILYDKKGSIKSLAQKEFTQYYPSPGWVEHDAMEIWESQLEVAKKAIKEANIKPADVAAIGITNQRETTVVWDRKTGEPIHKAIVWLDRRYEFYKNIITSNGKYKYSYS